MRVPLRRLCLPHRFRRDLRVCCVRACVRPVYRCVRRIPMNSRKEMSKSTQKTSKNTSSSKNDVTETELTEQFTELRTAFDLLDRNRDGRVTVSELQFMLQNLGIHVREDFIHELVCDASHTGAGLINEAEFLQWVGRIESLRLDAAGAHAADADDGSEDLVAAFRVFDRDRNGYITRDELRAAMDMIGERMTDQQLADLLALADVDRDGRINYEEFARLLL